MEKFEINKSIYSVKEVISDNVTPLACRWRISFYTYSFEIVLTEEDVILLKPVGILVGMVLEPKLGFWEHFS